jgi:hypothetical protein
VSRPSVVSRRSRAVPPLPQLRPLVARASYGESGDAWNKAAVRGA